jgi:hypothetical protein
MENIAKDEAQKSTETTAPEIVVSPNEYMNMQLTQYDLQIADSEINIAQQKLTIAKIKKQKIQTIIDFNVDLLQKKADEVKEPVKVKETQQN